MKFKEIYIRANQSIYDIAVQEYGHVDHVFQILKDNPSLDLNTDLDAGAVIKIDTTLAVVDKDVQDHFIENNLKSATGKTGVVAPAPPPVLPCSDVTTSVEGVGTSVDTPPGDNIDIQIVDESGSTVSSTLIEDTTVLKKLKVLSVKNTSSIIKSNANTSIISGDDSDLQRGRLTDWFTIDYLNKFGTNARYTGSTGGTYNILTAQYEDVHGNPTTESLAFPNTLIYDWSAWDRVNDLVFVIDYTPLTGVNNSAKFGTCPYTKGGVSNFNVLNIKELDRIFSYSSLGGFGLSWLPMNHLVNGVTANRVCSSTPLGSSMVGLINNVQRNTTGLTANNTVFAGAYADVSGI